MYGLIIQNNTQKYLFLIFKIKEIVSRKQYVVREMSGNFEPIQMW